MLLDGVELLDDVDEVDPAGVEDEPDVLEDADELDDESDELDDLSLDPPLEELSLDELPELPELAELLDDEPLRLSVL